MRVAYVFDQLLPRTAADTGQVLHTVSALGEAGVDVDLVVPRRRGERGPDLEQVARYYEVPPTFTVHVVGSTYPAWRGIEKLGHAIMGPLAQATRHADVLYTRNVPVLLSLLALRAQPVVYEHFRPWPAQYRAMAVLFSALARRARAPALVLHSAYAAASYRDVGFDPARMLVAHNGWDPRLMEPELDRAAARRACGLPDTQPIVLYSGHINPRKRLDTLLDLAERFGDARFVLVGSEGHGVVEQAAARLPNVEVRPWCSPRELVPLLWASDILAIPPSAGPLRDAGNTVLPLKTFIYLAAGRPIFGPDTPDLHELLRDGHNARLVAPDDPAAARRAMGELLADPDARARLGANARRDAAGLTWAARALKIRGFLEALA